MSVFASGLAALFADPNFGSAATYVAPGGGTPAACTVLVSRPDQDIDDAGMSARVRRISAKVEVRSSEVPAPIEGGVFAVGAKTYRIFGAPECLDPERLVWTCRCA